jgi:protein required for attachment to host cells
MTRTPAIALKTSGWQITHPRWPRTCILVADSGTARILQATRSAAPTGSVGRGAIVLKEIARLENPSAHLPGRALVTEGTGRVFDSGSRTGKGPMSHSRHGAQSDYDPHDIEVERFAKRLARRLDAERRRIGFEELIIIAGPRFLGVLRQQLSAASSRLVKREIDHDLVHSDALLIRRTAFPGAR